MKSLFLAGLLCLSSLSAFSQTNQPPVPAQPASGTSTANSTDGKYSGPLFSRPLLIGLNVGTPGIGLEGKLGLHEKWNLRLGLSFLPVHWNTNIFGNKDIKMNTDLRTSFDKVQLLGEFMPFHGKRFRLVGGISYFFAGKTTTKLAVLDNHYMGDITFTGDQVGTVTIATDWKGIAPYLGIGLFPDFPKRRFNVNLDLGTYYMSAASVAWSDEKLLSGNEANAAVIQRNLEQYRWFPTLQLNFNYKLSSK